MTVVNDQVYIFGGAMMKCICKVLIVNKKEDTRVCTSKNVYSNELWHYDPLTSMFFQLGWNLEESKEEEMSPWPWGREQHSMTALPNGHLVLIGGISSSNDEYEIEEKAHVLLNDVWTMRNPHRTIPSMVFNSSSNDLVDLLPGHVTDHVMPISLRDDDVHRASIGEEEQMCIHNIRVKLSIDRICTNAIQYIKLTAPGTAAQRVADHYALQSRDYETKIFVSREECAEKKCQESSLDLLLSDDAEEWVLSYASIHSGTFRPASSLVATFGGLPIDGEWKLTISMAQPVDYPEEYHGRLFYWELQIDAKPCAVDRPRWQKLPSPPSDFSPRRLHTAVAVENSIFITGGYATRRLSDMWRFDFDTNTWTDLTDVTGVENGRYLPLYGQATLLGPFGLLAYGGMAKYGTRNQGHDLFLLDLFEGDWVTVPIPQHDSARNNRRFNNGIPYGRYFTSIGMLNNVDSIYKSYNVDGTGAMILAFGGDGALLHNTHADSSGFLANSLFDDVWLLSPGGIGIRNSSKMNQQRTDHQCNWRSIPGSTAFQIWESTCGIDATKGDRTGECRLESVLIAAWCRFQYQSF